MDDNFLDELFAEFMAITGALQMTLEIQAKSLCDGGMDAGAVRELLAQVLEKEIHAMHHTQILRPNHRHDGIRESAAHRLSDLVTAVGNRLS